MCSGLMQIWKAICVSGTEISHKLCIKGFFIALQKKEAPNSPREKRLLLRTAETPGFIS